MRHVQAAVRDEGKPITAMQVAILIYGADKAGTRLTSIISQLDTLRTDGQITSQTDEAGVMRWSLVPAESGAAMELGAEVWMAGHYEPSLEQRERLGL